MLVIGGKRMAVDGLQGADFTEDPELGLSRPMGWRPRRTRWVRGLVLHTRLGLPVVPVARLAQRRGRPGWDEVFARRLRRSHRYAGAHIAVDADGSYVCVADLLTAAAYHAGQVNEYTVGVEMYQDSEGRVALATLEATAVLCDAITRALGIQRQCPIETGICRRFASPRRGWRRAQRLAYMRDGARGADYVGVYGHRNCTRNRGPGDPGDEVFELLRRRGYEAYAVDIGQDLAIWAERQASLGFEPEQCDGIPGPRTRAALERERGLAGGLWVQVEGEC